MSKLLLFPMIHKAIAVEFGFPELVTLIILRKTH